MRETALAEQIVCWRRDLESRVRACALAAASQRPSLDEVLARVAVNVARFTLFEKVQVVVLQLHLHGHDFLLRRRRQVAAVDESESALLDFLDFVNVGFGLGVPGG
jgi:hypothetical protein